MNKSVPFENGRDSGCGEGWDECERYYQPLIDAVARWATTFRAKRKIEHRGSYDVARTAAENLATETLLAVSARFMPKEAA